MRRLCLTLLAVAAGLPALFGSAADANHDGSLAARYPFDSYDSGTQRTPDASGHNLFLQLFGSDVFLFPGQFGNAAAFNGFDTGFQRPNDPLLEPPDSAGLSLHAWVRFHPDNEGGAQTPGPNKVLVAKGGRGCRAPSYELSTGKNEGLEFAVDMETNVAAGNVVVRSPAIAPDEIWDNRFHAVTGVYGATTEDGVRSVQLWVDGVQVGAREIPADALRINYAQHVSDRQLTVGRIIQDSCAEDRSFSGDIDDLRIYSQALARRQIRYLAENDRTTPPDLTSSPPPGFANWTAVESGKVSGTLLGSSISLTGAGVDANSNLEGFDDRFNRPAFTPSLLQSDSPGFFGATGNSYTLHFGAPVRDPLMHLSSLSSTLQFQPGTSLTRVSGDDGFAASGSTVSGVGEGGYGPDSNGTVRLNGVFTQVSFTTSYAGSDPIVFQVGRPRPLPPANTVRPQVSGTPTPGQVLSCTTGQWTGSSSNVVYTYTWERAPRQTRFEDDQAWGPIDGASGTNKTQYTVQPIDLSSRVRCRVTRSDDGGVDDAASRSLRVDSGVPVNVTPPTMTGSAQSTFGVLTCEPGEWQNGPSFTYQWIRDGSTVIAGATKRTYTPTRRRDLSNPSAVSNPNGDGNHQIACRVTASNDVGSGAPVTTESLLAFDDIPLNVRSPSISAPVGRPGESLVGKSMTCDEGQWEDGYGQFRREPYLYRYEWTREGAPISGATGRDYQVAVDDLGRRIRCVVRDSNPQGISEPAASAEFLVPLPHGQDDSLIYRTGGRNEADPTNLLAVSDPYLDVVNEVVVGRLNRAIAETREDCRTLPGVPQRAPDPDSFGFRLRPAGSGYFTKKERCQILLFAPERVAVLPQGVRYLDGKCTADHRVPDPQYPPCRSLSFQVAPVDPRRPPAADTELLERLAPVTPQTILWDIDRDGKTDAACPGSAPVLRTILRKGRWYPRATIVSATSAETGIFSSGETQFGTPGGNEQNPGSLRKSQVKVCATAFDPPPDPEQGPCVTNGEIGRVQLSGDLCPIDLRQIDKDDFANFDGDLKKVLIAQSEERLRSEGIVTARAGEDLKSREPVWLDRQDARGGGGFLKAIDSDISKQANGIAATYSNTAASLTSFRTGDPAPKLSKELTKKLDAIPSVKVKNAGFALDQIYISRADTMKINGVTLDPLGKSAALLVPSDVRAALPKVKAMTVSARDAATALGPIKNGIPLATGGNLKSVLPDEKTAAQALLRETNLDQVLEKLKRDASKLNLGPFKLRGDAKVKLENDGTATLEAYAVLPGLSVGPPGNGSGSGEIRADVKLRADLEGRVKLQGLRVRAPYAYLGPIKLQDIDITYENGLDVKGKILFPPPVRQGIGINQFKLGPDGEFQILDVDYLAGAGSGIPVGTGVFITKLGGRLDLLSDTIKGNTTVSVGPAAADGGCPTVGIDAEFAVHFAELFYLDATGNVKLVCLSLAQIKFHADQTGLVTLDGGVDISVGPLFYKANLGAGIRLPNWQVTSSGEGGVRGIPLIGTVSLGFKLALSNIGLAGCGGIELPFPLPDLKAGAGVRFAGGLPPFNPLELVANLRFFTGCDISAYYSVVQRAKVRGAQAGSTSFTIPKGTGPSLLSIEGAGGAPRVRLRTPSGKVLDYTDATGVDGKAVDAGLGTVIESEDRTVVLLGRTEAGNWTAETADGSPAVVRIRRADILPQPSVKGRVTGSGSKRVLSYDVKPLRGQVVRLVEVARGGQKILRTVKGGGRGRVRFTVSEASGTKRKIVAQVAQDGLPRTDLTVARFSAPSPRVGPPRRVRVRRRGRRAIVTWRAAVFAKDYEVAVRYGVGRRVLLTPKRGKRSIVVPRVRRNEGLVVSVVAFSPAGHRGAAATGKLKGQMRVGEVKKKKRKRRRR